MSTLLRLTVHLREFQYWPSVFPHEPRTLGPLFSKLKHWDLITGGQRWAVSNTLDEPDPIVSRLSISRSYSGTEFPAGLLQDGRHGNRDEILRGTSN